MVTRANPMGGRYFNNPMFAQAMSNLAGAFGPPSPQELLAYEQIGGQRFSNDAARQAWEALTAEGVTPETQDRFGMAGMAAFGGRGWTPSQSHRSVDIASADRRYATDVGARTDLERQALVNEARMREAIFGAAVDPSGRQGVDAQLMSAITGIPGVGFDAAQPVAPTRAQVEGGIIAGLSPEEQRAIGFGNTPIEQVVGPDGAPTNVLRPDAVGQEPFVRDTTRAASQIFEWESPDGQNGQARFDPNSGELVDIRTGAALPEGARTFRVEGGDRGAASGITTAGRTAADARFQSTVRTLEILGEVEETLGRTPGAVGIVGQIQRAIGGIAQVASEATQLAVQSGMDPQMMLESGLIDVDTYSRFFNPELAELDRLLNGLVWAYASSQQADGRVSNQQMEQTRRQLGVDGPLANTAALQSALRGLRREMERDLRSLSAVASPDIARAFSPEVRNPGAQPPAAAPAGAPAAAGADQFRELFQQAEDAITQGAPREAVMEELRRMLREAGADPGVMP